MKINRFDDREEWMLARKGRITGSRAGDITLKRGGARKIGYYEIMAERLAVTEEDFDGYVPNETPMARGTRLEPEALERFSRETGKKLDTSLVIWTMDDNENIANSPDASVIEDSEVILEAVDAKCLSSARHLEAYFTQEIPDDYHEQGIQYFVTCETLQKLIFAFYDPRIVVKDFFVIEMNREDFLEEIENQKDHQIKTLNDLDKDIASLISF